MRALTQIGAHPAFPSQRDRRAFACETGGAPCADDGTVPRARSPRQSGRCWQAGSRAAADQRRLVAAARSNPDARGPVKPCSKSLAKFASPRLELPGCKAWAPHLGALVSCDALIDMVRQLGDRLTVGHRSSADFVSITSARALQSLLDEAETYREQPSIL